MAYTRKINAKFRRGFTTDSGLLNRMAEADNQAWIDFDTKYRDMIYEVGKQRGILESDCEDLMQDVMIVCCQRIQNFFYDRSKGHFRSYLTRIVNNLAWQRLRKQKDLPDQPVVYDESIDQEFMRQYEEFLIQTSLELLQKRVGNATYSAFEMMCIQGLPIPEVSAITRKSARALYLIRFRCIRILRQCIQQIPEAADRIHSAGNSSKNASQLSNEQN